MNRRLTVGLGWLARIAMIVCSLVNTRLLIGLLNVDGYASVAILLSLAPWLALLNLGLPNAVQNQIAQARAAGGDSRQIQNSAMTFALLLMLASLPISGLIALMLQHSLLDRQHALPWVSVTAIVWSLVGTGLTAVFSQILLAHHRGTLPSTAPALQAVLTSLGLLAVHRFGREQGIEVALALAAPVLVVFAVLAFRAAGTGTFGLELRRLPELMRAARGFLLFAAISTFAVACDYIVMARLLAGVEIAQYSLVSKCFNVVLSLQAVVLSVNWTSFSDLFFRGELTQVWPRIRKVLGVGFGLMATACIPLVVGLDGIVGLLSGNTIPSIGLATVAAATAYTALRVWTDTFAMVLMSWNQTKMMNGYIVWQSVLAVSLQWLLGQTFGVPGIFAGAALAFVLTASWILPCRVRLILSTPRIA